jgi:hypothetical protein
VSTNQRKTIYRRNRWSCCRIKELQLCPNWMIFEQIEHESVEPGCLHTYINCTNDNALWDEANKTLLLNRKNWNEIICPKWTGNHKKKLVGRGCSQNQRPCALGLSKNLSRIWRTMYVCTYACKSTSRTRFGSTKVEPFSGANHELRLQRCKNLQRNK